MIPFSFKNFPMPPSANDLYCEASHFNPRMRGRIKTRDYREYEEQVKIWMYRNGPTLQAARIAVARLQIGEALHLERRFYFERSQVLTKRGNPKRNDTSNRIKALDDALGQLLTVDDSLFWCGSETKLIAPFASVEIIFSSVSIRFEETT